jgi:trehalose-phosphatase
LPLPDRVLCLIRQNPLFLFLDFDGTLAPIVNDPAKAKIKAAEKKLIRALSQCAGVRVAVVTGRSLTDIKSKVGIDPLIYMGNHGLEYEGPFMKHVHPAASALKHKMKKVARQLREALKGFPAVRVEDKTFTLSVHYRQLQDNLLEAREAVYAVLAPYLKSREMMIRQGKKVWEIRPRTDWNKGKMVLWALARFSGKSSKKTVPFYFGDDETDEDVFRILGEKGIGVRITRNPEEVSFARYYLESPAGVFRVLRTIQSVKKNEKRPALV